MPQIVHSARQIYWENGLEGFMATQDMEAVAEFIDQQLPEVYYINSEPGCIDIMATSVSPSHPGTPISSTPA